MKLIRDIDVLSASQKRIEFLFDNFKTIRVSVSSGKDSSVIFSLCLREAIKRNRKIEVLFIDQEAEYQSSIDVIEECMVHPNIIPLWYQVPIYMTNSTSESDYFLYAWGENEKWIRDKHPLAIKSIDGDYKKRFYTIFDYLDKQSPDTINVIGLRAEESITRYRATTKTAGYNDIKWSTKAKHSYKFYPIYDWSVSDVWKYIYDFNVKYNKIYDLMFMDGKSIYSEMRVSNLIHEKSFKCLIDLPKYEPETYNKMCNRINGISTASRYASEKLMFSNRTLPTHYNTWLEFRDFLLGNIQNEEHKSIFTQRFETQSKDEITYKAQVGQLLINDFENSKSFNTQREEKLNNMRDKWKNIL